MGDVLRKVWIALDLGWWAEGIGVYVVAFVVGFGTALLMGRRPNTDDIALAAALLALIRTVTLSRRLRALSEDGK